MWCRKGINNTSRADHASIVNIITVHSCLHIFIISTRLTKVGMSLMIYMNSLYRKCDEWVQGLFSMCFFAVNRRCRNDNEVLISEKHRNGIAKIVQSTIDSTILLQVKR